MTPGGGNPYGGHSPYATTPGYQPAPSAATPYGQPMYQAQQPQHHQQQHHPQQQYGGGGDPHTPQQCPLCPVKLPPAALEQHVNEVHFHDLPEDDGFSPLPRFSKT